MIHFKFKILLLMVYLMFTTQVSASKEEFRKKVEQEWKKATSFDYMKPQELIKTKVESPESLKEAFELIQKNMLTSVFIAHTTTMNETKELIKELSPTEDQIESEKAEGDLQKEFEGKVLQQNLEEEKKTDSALESILNSYTEYDNTDKLIILYKQIQEIILSSALNVHDTDEQIQAMQNIINSYEEEYAKKLTGKLKNDLYNKAETWKWDYCFKTGGNKIKDATLDLAWKEYQTTEIYKKRENITKMFKVDFNETEKKLFDEKIKDQWLQIQNTDQTQINFEIKALEKKFANTQDGYQEALKKVRDTAIKFAFKVYKEMIKETEEALLSILLIKDPKKSEEAIKFKNLKSEHKKLQKDFDDAKKQLAMEDLKAQKKKLEEETKDLKAQKEKLEEETKKLTNEVKQLEKQKANVHNDNKSIPVEKVKELIQEIQKRIYDGKEINLKDIEKSVLSEANKLKVRSSENAKNTEAADLIKKLSTSIKKQEQVKCDDFPNDLDKEDVTTIVEKINGIQKYEIAVSGLKKITEGAAEDVIDKNAINEFVETKELATEINDLRASKACYRTSMIFCIVIIVLGASAFLYMSYTSNKSEEKSSEESDEESTNDVTSKKSSKTVDEKMMKKVNENSVKVEEKTDKKVDDKAIEKVDDEAVEKFDEKNPEVPAQVSKEFKDTKTPAKNDVEMGHILIDVKEQKEDA